MVAFWGCEVTETKAAVVDVPEGFVLNVCNATSGVASAGAQVALGLETPQLDGKAWKGAVAHLGGPQPLQVKLDLVFGRKVKFYLAKGSGAVNLTGYFQPGPPADLFEVEEPPKVEAAAPAKKSKKRAREEKKEQQQKSWDEVSPSSTDSEEVPEKKVKADKPATAPPPAKKEEQKKPKPAETPAKASTPNDAAPSGSSQKRKRKKNKHKKQHAANGEAK
ncbi:Nucleoplasmin core domain [Phytophthora cinnamomi]|uniref:Nucleoplasmin core domain n=1 Tax=Phytophthora cinnamomi TaxID=4785 RepID=UPI00355A7E79|nr:Nucleoplasmin core domain [Phytophthora cinnamomi]